MESHMVLTSVHSTVDFYKLQHLSFGSKSNNRMQQNVNLKLHQFFDLCILHLPGLNTITNTTLLFC